MSTTGTSDRYVAEYIDGPLKGTTEHRYLTDGEPEERVSQVALVEGTESLFWYVAGERRELNGGWVVRYGFDQDGSDPLEGAADQDAESRSL